MRRDLYDKQIKPVPKCGATGKRLFKSYEAALEFLGSIEGGEQMRAYRCAFCAGYHVTSHPFR